MPRSSWTELTAHFKPSVFANGMICPSRNLIPNPSERFRFEFGFLASFLMVYDHLPKKEVKFTRHNIFERDKNTCQYCGHSFERKDLNLDHVIPRDRGGPTTWENIVCSCIECNTRKANRTPQEAVMHLIRKPKRPKWRPFVQINFSLHHHDSWKHFIDLAYWNVELGEDVA
jgi:Restriction endonuclease